MGIKRKIFIAVAFSLFVFFLVFTAYCSDIYPDIDIPIASDAYELRKGVNQKLRAKFVNYKVIAEFPAEVIINLYDEFFDDRGYLQFSEDGYGKRRWENFDYSSGEWRSTGGIPARYVATWVDHRRKTRSVLVLRYMNNVKSGETADSELYVDCKIVPYFSLDSKDSPK